MDIPALPICKITLRAQKPSNIPQNPVSIGEHIKKRRLEQGLFQREVAKIIGVTENSVYSWENNSTEPPNRFIPKIIEFLGYNPLKAQNLTLGEHIIYYRKINGLSQKKLAMHLNVDEGTERRWEKNKCKPFQRLLNLLNL